MRKFIYLFLITVIAVEMVACADNRESNMSHNGFGRPEWKCNDKYIDLYQCDLYYK